MPTADDETPYRMQPAGPEPEPPPPPDWRPRRRRRAEVGDFWDRIPDLGLVDAIPLTYTMQVNLGAGLAVLIIVGVFVVLKLVSPPVSLFALVAIPFASVFWSWGCAAYAKNRGYPDLVGLLGFTGYLWLLPNRSHG